MARRANRRRGLGFSTDEHRAQISKAANDARRSAADAVRAVASGSCSTAVRALAKAEFSLGMASAHAHSGNAAVGAATREAFDSVLNAQDAVASRCTIKR